MKFDMTSIDGAAAGSLELDETVFGLEPRGDLIARMVRWQLAKRQAGDHKTLGRADIHRTGKKMYKQKGTGGARHGSARVPQFRAAAARWGPSSAATSTTCRRRCARWRCAMRLSAKVRAGELIVWEHAQLAEAKTKTLRASFAKTSLHNVLIIDGAEVDENFAAAARNLPLVDVLPVQGANVFDIMRRGKLVLTKAAIEALEARFK